MLWEGDLLKGRCGHIQGCKRARSTAWQPTLLRVLGSGESERASTQSFKTATSSQALDEEVEAAVDANGAPHAESIANADASQAAEAAAGGKATQDAGVAAESASAAAEAAYAAPAARLSLFWACGRLTL